jgi:hypothetical protein
MDCGFALAQALLSLGKEVIIKNQQRGLSEHRADA